MSTSPPSSTQAVPAAPGETTAPNAAPSPAAPGVGGVPLAPELAPPHSEPALQRPAPVAPHPESALPRPSRPLDGATPKLRSRKHGAAVPLQELDKRLLNLMQGSFPIAPRPYRHVAELAGIAEEQTMERVRALLQQRIIRQVTPIFDTRALGYSSMLVAAKVDPEHPHRAAAVINAHPGVSHNYLRNHEFNLWFTIATEPDSPLGLEGTLEVLAGEAGAQSVRQLPTLKLFKIRMDLEMEGDTQALARPVETREPIELDPQPYDELDVAVIRALQGDMPVVQEPYAPAAARIGLPQRRFLEHLEGMRERGLLRRVAAILYHRRAGFSANGMGVWKVPDEQILDVGRRMAAVRGISHCYQRPTYADWPYSVFTMAHGRSKGECDAILDAIAAQTGISERATLYSSTEFKKIRLLYFTDEFKAWERAHT
jgi:siroheme decarboxylase